MAFYSATYTQSIVCRYAPQQFSGLNSDIFKKLSYQNYQWILFQFPDRSHFLCLIFDLNLVSIYLCLIIKHVFKYNELIHL